MRLSGTQLHAWADGCGANPYHPDTWTPVQRQSFMDFKLQKFRDHCHWLARLAPRDWWPRAMLIDTLRRDALEALRPPPSQTYQQCPCHRSRKDALAFIETFKPTR